MYHLNASLKLKLEKFPCEQNLHQFMTRRVISCSKIRSNQKKPPIKFNWSKKQFVTITLLNVPDTNEISV